MVICLDKILNLCYSVVSALILNSATKKAPPLVTKSLSDEALREVKKSFKLDKINGNMCREATGKKI